jgi:hypothetical protein
VRGACVTVDVSGMSFSVLDIALTAFVALLLLTFVLLIWDLGFRRAKGRQRVQAAHPAEPEPPRLEVVGSSRPAA